MTKLSRPTEFDCLRLDDGLVKTQPHDEIIPLLSLYQRLEEECDVETDKLEALANSIHERTELAQSTPAAELLSDARWLIGRTALTIQERAQIASRFRVPYHIFGTARVSRGGKDLELDMLEITERKIQNYLAQISELEVEIASVVPTTPKGFILKFQFLARLCVEGSEFANDVFPYVVDQSIAQLGSVLGIFPPDKVHLDL